MVIEATLQDNKKTTYAHLLATDKDSNMYSPKNKQVIDVVCHSRKH